MNIICLQTTAGELRTGGCAGQTRGSYLFFLKPVIAACLAVVFLSQSLTPFFNFLPDASHMRPTGPVKFFLEDKRSGFNRGRPIGDENT